MERKRIGVFVCHCGLNIAGSVNVEKVVEEIKKCPGVVHAENYIYMCSDPGQDLIRKAIEEKQLDAVVNCNCSPSLHENTFRGVASSQGINPYHCEIANIREWCSWAHAKDPETATKKAIQIIQSTIERLRKNEALTPMVVPITKKVLVIGGGIAGMQAALDIANSGYQVYLVEKSPSLGGHVTQLSGLVLTMENASCNIGPIMEEVVKHPLIDVFTYSEVEEVDGYVGSFNIKVRRKATSVDPELCDSCGLCQEKCPQTVPSEFDCSLSARKAIYRPHAGAIPDQFVIDRDACLYFHGGECQICKEVCPQKAIDYSREDIIDEIKVGAIVVATGYDLYPKKVIEEYEEDPDVLDGLQFERLLSPQGPTKGKIKRPSDGKVPKEVVFIQCVGSRDPENHKPYCSRICCMYTAKQAILYKRVVPDGQVYIFYIDIRATGKGYEEFIKEGVEEEGLLYLRGRVSKIFRDGDKITVWGVDTLINRRIEISADMVVLSMAVVGNAGNRELGKKLNVITDNNCFVTEAHPKLGPVETLTAGIYLCGTAQAPKDIPDTIAQASGAASKILSLFSRKELLHEPQIACVDQEVCSGCGYCESICAYRAVEVDPKKRVAVVNEAVCEACGACAATCPSGAIQLKNFDRQQLMNMIDQLTKDYSLAS
ncbi:MAG: CoB--CoM heterodisulfide reductase iron-sulfur subunit A family protein [Deltaproteobacteria bacterium]|jgi:heterodisulfide reductase subunit A|nr:CoB--CoM heterodisulfide reductase iron-sulfur subunit A family protein [Deltaproteobacteria bacterium]